MRDVVLGEIKGFLRVNYLEGKPLLLGCSGGPDSSVLLYALKECCRFFPFEVHVAHIDHAWRQGSDQEALALKKRVEGLGFPFYLKRLAPPQGGGNLEERAREARLAIFAALYRELGCQALLMAHQAEDQAETVLKRVLEGASLMHLGGMKGVSTLRDMVVWRPLLKVNRSKILSWIEKRGIPVVDDKTNLDPQFLRGRMRTALFPELRRLFGKEVVAPLGNIGHSAHELQEYLEKRIAPYLNELVVGADGALLDLSHYLPMEGVELKTLVRLLCKRMGVSLSLDSVELLCKLLNSRASKKKIEQKGASFCVHRGVLSIKFVSQ